MKTRNLAWASIAGVALAVAGLPVLAQTTTTQPPAKTKAEKQASREAWEVKFRKADTNYDGALSRDEITKANQPEFTVILQNFDAMDSNKDGKVSLDERRNWGKEKRASAEGEWEIKFRKADTNYDGGLSRDEITKANQPEFAIISQNFDAMDKNRDGKVSIEERRAWGEANRGEAWEMKFRKADTNYDGGLSRDEITKANQPEFTVILQNFDAMDKNRDGRVTIEERRAWGETNKR